MKASTQKLIYLTPLVGFLAMAWFLLQGLERDPKHLPSAKIGKPFPVFSLTSLTEPNRTLSEADIKGQPGLVNIWATWCPSCKIEHGTLNAIAQSGVAIYGVNYKDDRQAAQQYLRHYGDPYTLSVFDPNGDLGLDLGVYGAPETFVVDAQGMILYRHAGVVDQQVWEQVLRPTLDASTSSTAAAESAQADAGLNASGSSG